MAKKYLIFMVILAIAVAGGAFIGCKDTGNVPERSLPEAYKGDDFIRLMGDADERVLPYIKALANELNKRDADDGEPFLLYSGRFGDNDEIFKLPSFNKKAVLLLGGAKLMPEDWAALKNYGTILDTSGAYNRANAFFFPLPFIDSGESLVSEEPQFYALINKPAIISEILKDKGLPFKEYSTNDLKALYQDLPHFKAIFAADTGVTPGSYDLHPFFLEAMAKGVLLIGSPYFDNGVTFSFLGDYATYYLTKDEVSTSIDLIEQGDTGYLMRAKEASRFVKSVLEIKPMARRMLGILEDKKIPELDFGAEINIDTIGLSSAYSGGDYWLGHDLGALLVKAGKDVTYSYRNSMLFPKTKLDIIIRGRLNGVKRGEKNILWLVYFRVPSTDRSKKTFDEYIKKVISYAEGFDGVATGSLVFYEMLKGKVPHLSYIPQFTDTQKFYPDFDEKYKSEILFIGSNFLYRKAAPIALKHKLPITIYGPEWPEGVAKETYVDNRILRKYYSSAKIVLNDAREEMIDYGFIINRIFDVTASGGFVISDYMKEIEEIYGDTIPMWKTEEEFFKLINYYLDPKHEEERLDKARRAREITLENFTSDKAKEKFLALIDAVLNED